MYRGKVHMSLSSTLAHGRENVVSIEFGYLFMTLRHSLSFPVFPQRPFRVGTNKYLFESNMLPTMYSTYYLLYTIHARDCPLACTNHITSSSDAELTRSPHPCLRAMANKQRSRGSCGNIAGVRWGGAWCSPAMIDSSAPRQPCGPATRAHAPKFNSRSKDSGLFKTHTKQTIGCLALNIL